MTRKHFVTIAASLKEQNASYETCIQVTNALIKTNDSFDHNRFMAACGFDDFALTSYGCKIA